MLRVLKCMHFVLSMFRESLFVTNQLSMLLSSLFALLYKFFWFFPEINIVVSSAKAKQLLYLRHLGKSLTYIINQARNLVRCCEDRFVNEYKVEKRKSSIFIKSGSLHFKFSERDVPAFSIAMRLLKLFF